MKSILLNVACIQLNCKNAKQRLFQNIVKIAKDKGDKHCSYNSCSSVDTMTWCIEACKKFMIIICLALIWLTVAHADPTNLLQNGDFSVESFVFDAFHVMDVIADGINTLVPFWTTVDGGVQVLDTQEWSSPRNFSTPFIVHMNYKSGPGTLMSMPMYTMRKGAIYTISMYMADNPDGGPTAKSFRMTLTDIYGKRLGDKLMPFVISHPSVIRQRIVWETVSCNVRGTGIPAILTIQSLTPGSYGALVVGIQVVLSTLVDNGSFEDIDSSIKVDNITYFQVLSSPSSFISKWTIESGSLKICSAARYQASTDNTPIILDLNAANQPATLSTQFPAHSNTEYMLLFDTAINPEQVQPLQGQLVIWIDGIPSSQRLLAEQLDLDSNGYTVDNVGWITYSYAFKTVKEDYKVKVTFTSKIAGSFGPLLDNVVVYEVTKSLKDANETEPNVPPTVESQAHMPPPLCIPAIAGLILIIINLQFSSF